jgi:hypothetical protein
MADDYYDEEEEEVDFFNRQDFEKGRLLQKALRA